MTDNRKDAIFNIDAVREDFAFTGKVVEVFDDMLNRSVPFYSEVIRAEAALLKGHLQSDDTVVDLGCSTGTTLLQFCRLLPDETIHYIGIDTSEAMLAKARTKAENYSKGRRITFCNQDITAIQMAGIGAFVVNYTMQFIRPVRRQEFIETLFATLRPGGILLLSEKTINPDPALNRTFIDIYHSYKKEMGYSELEIARKREALENVLIPFSIDENRQLLKKAGFTRVDTCFQWFNFVSFVAVKPE